jgi:hypothetical protein
MPRSKKLRRRLLALYVASYVPLTLAGEYTIANHGGMDWRREWVPVFVLREYRAPNGCTKLALTVAGVFYLPLIVADQLLWHCTDSDPDPKSTAE